MRNTHPHRCMGFSSMLYSFLPIALQYALSLTLTLFLFLLSFPDQCRQGNQLDRRCEDPVDQPAPLPSFMHNYRSGGNCSRTLQCFLPAFFLQLFLRSFSAQCVIKSCSHYRFPGLSRLTCFSRFSRFQRQDPQSAFHRGRSPYLFFLNDLFF